MNRLFKFGILLFMFSYIIGYGGFGLASLLYINTNKKLWLLIGPGFYGLSWIIMGVSFLICGKEGLKIYRKKIDI